MGNGGQGIVFPLGIVSMLKYYRPKGATAPSPRAAPQGEGRQGVQHHYSARQRLFHAVQPPCRPFVTSLCLQLYHYLSILNVGPSHYMCREKDFRFAGIITYKLVFLRNITIKKRELLKYHRKI